MNYGEPWKHSTDEMDIAVASVGGLPFDNVIVKENGVPVCYTQGGCYGNAVQRRIAACVNACRHLTDDQLAAINQTGGFKVPAEELA